MLDHTALFTSTAGCAVVEVGLFLSVQLIERSPADSFNSFNAGFGVMAVLGRGDFFLYSSGGVLSLTYQYGEKSHGSL